MDVALLDTLRQIPLVDHHAHSVLRAHPATLDEFRGLFSESADPRQWPHVATAVSYRRGIEQLADEFGCEASEEAVFEFRISSPPREYAGRLLRGTGTEELYLDDGFPPADVAFSLEEMAELADCATRPVMRIERVAEEALAEGLGLDALKQRLRDEVAAARSRGYVGLKTIAAYRTGLAVSRPTDGEASEAFAATGQRLDAKPLVDLVLYEALEANAAEPLPLQVHSGFGDGDLLLPAANPALLKPVIERFRETPFVLLHCYPFVREAGWLAHVYPNVFLDVSLTIPHVARPAEMVRQALELAPLSKLMYASDAARAPELYFLGARRWREALAEVLPELSGDQDASARAILRENARALYGEGR
jgi:uncharacterized protein